MELKSKTALVIGASSGIGEAMVRRLAAEGWTVAAVARRADRLAALAEDLNAAQPSPRVYAFPHNVTDYDHVPELFDTIFEALGGLSLVVYAAGTMPHVAPAEYNFAKDREMVETNLLGMMAWLNCAADLFYRLKAGTIVGVGSIAGDRGRRGQPGYNTSKGAQAIYLEALRNRLTMHGVRVLTVKPGYVQTAMTAGQGNLLWMITADEAARRILHASQTSYGTVYVPRRWRLVSWVIRAIPSPLFRKLEI